MHGAYHDHCTNFLATFPLCKWQKHQCRGRVNTKVARKLDFYSLFCRLMEDEDSSICSPSATANWTSLMGYNDTAANHLDWEDPWNNLTSSTSLPSNLSIETSSSSQNRMPAAVMIPTGIMLYVLSLLTFVGNAMVLHAIRTDKRLQTVSFYSTF